MVSVYVDEQKGVVKQIITSDHMGNLKAHPLSRVRVRGVLLRGLGFVSFLSSLFSLFRLFYLWQFIFLFLSPFWKAHTLPPLRLSYCFETYHFIHLHLPLRLRRAAQHTPHPHSNTLATLHCNTATPSYHFHSYNPQSSETSSQYHATSHPNTPTITPSLPPSP